MLDSIKSLTDDQAIRAVKLFFDFSAAELWEAGEKPSPVRVKQIAAALVTNSPADVKPILAALVEDGQAAAMPARAEVSRLILGQLSQSPGFQSTVDLAVATAAQPHKSIEPFTGAFILVCWLATTEIEHTPRGGLKIKPGAGLAAVLKQLRLPELLHELPEVIKALPKSVLSALREIH